MSNYLEPPHSDPISRAIWTALVKETERIVDEEAKAAADRVQGRVRDRVGSIVSKVAQHFTFEYGQSQIVIRVDFNTPSERS